MGKVSFIKMHGLGNDFVIVENSALAKLNNLKDFVIKISDRRIGIGCDQFITYSKQDVKSNEVLMNIFNQDGSKAKACGNASRCLSRLIFDKYGISAIDIKIGEKIVPAQYHDPKNITVNMGIANFAANWMPKNEELWQLAEKYTLEPKELICVDIGNPHLVIFSKLGDKDKKLIGKKLQKNPLFANNNGASGINVNFAEIASFYSKENTANVINLKVWERGTGFTMACGSGASATFAASNKLGFTTDEGTVRFEIGSLKMKKNGNNEILMTGPAEYVFSGEYHYDE